MPAPIHDAVTALLCHQGEIYMVHRRRDLAAFPGYHAFPGGKVDAVDSEHDYPPAVRFNLEARLFRALVRELDEELGMDWRFDGEAAGHRHDIIHCVPLGTAVPPSFAPRRFNTFFFRLDLRARPAMRLEAHELAGGEWASPRDFLARYERGELLIAPPTLLALRTFAANPSAAAIPFRDFGRGDDDSVPVIEAQHGVKSLMVRSNTLPPAMHTNCFLIGDAGSPRLLIDPSPHSAEELQRLHNTAAALGFDEILLTHHHPDHCEFAERLAREAGVPIGASADTQMRIRERTPQFFDGLTVKTWSDGDLVTRWLDHPVRAIAVPGHDEGQLALMPDNRAWCIVGDLIQGIGTVVIKAPEGDMRKYFASLEKLIAAAPAVIYPSHGMALGSTFYLEQTLAHRRTREAQIKTLSDAGKSGDEMLDEIYKDTDPRLLPLARMNIESHLVKLRAEGALGTQRLA